MSPVARVPKTDVVTSLDVARHLQSDIGATDVLVDANIARVSLIGAGMKTHPGVAAKAFETLADAGIEPEVVTTSPIKIACHIRSDEVETAVAVLHHAFELDTPEAERQHA